MTIREQDDVRLLKSPAEIWSLAQKVLLQTLKLPTYNTSIRSAQLRQYANGEALLAVKNTFMRDMIVNNHYKAVVSALVEVTQEPVVLKVVIDDDIICEIEEPTIASISVIPADPDPRLRSQVGALNQLPPQPLQATDPYSPSSRAYLDPKYKFESFVVGADNRFCHSAALAVAGKPGFTYNPLFIYGGVGLGKTHIMHAIGHEILRHSPRASIRYISCERFTNELISAIGEGKMLDFRKRYRQVDVLLVDDIQFLEKKDRTQEEFFHTFEALRNSSKQIVLSSDRPPKALVQLEERLRSRFEWGLIADIQPPDLETRIAILRKKRESEAMRISDEALELIASSVTSNIRELEGALIRASAYASLTGVELTMKELASILRSSTPDKSKKTLTIDIIIDTVAEHYRLEPSDLRSAKRSQDLSLPRHLAMYLAHDLMLMSFPRIGQAFGNRKHTSALYAHSRIKEQILKDADLSRAVRDISRKLSD